MNGFGIWCISHTKTKNIVEKGMEDTEGYTVLTSNLSNSYEGIFGDIFDCVLTGMIDREVQDGKTQSITRKLFLRGTHYVDAGCRFAMDSVPEYITFDKPNNAPEFIKIIKKGMELSKRSSAKTRTTNIEPEIASVETPIETPEQKVVTPVQEAVPQPIEQIVEELPQQIEDVIQIQQEEPQLTNEELFAKIRPLYTKATKEDKQKVKDIIVSYGFAKFDLSAPGSMFQEVFHLLDK